jgi:protoheme IX farnesyltransferase
MASAVARTPLGALAVLSLIWTFVLVVLGVVVRVTGAGLGCPDWPLCHGRLIPPLEPGPLIEYAHRLSAALSVALVAGTAVVVWARRRGDRQMVGLAGLAVGLVFLQVLLGAITVWLELPETWVTAHLATAEALLGVLTLLAIRALRPAGSLRSPRVLYATTALALYTLILTGAHVRGSDASLACLDWPLCLPLLPAPGPLAIQLVHRYMAALVGALVAVCAVVAWREGLRFLAGAAAALFAAQVLIGAGYLSTAGSPLLQGAHLAFASAAWCVLVALATRSSLAAERERRGPALADLVALTKPPIVALLLVTAIGGMFLAAQGTPPLVPALAVLAGGALAAGGANALNHYFDRDIDELMARTRRRPLPGGRVTARDALAFGVALNVVAFAVLALFANLLAAAITLGAAIFYVLVYTLWLKRTTVQNVVIGGAAGCVPPLVGWAAVRGDLALPAYVLFAIVFFWTPAHFWALALLIREDYDRAGVPMLPVVYGERATAWGILLYAIATVALTVLLFTTRAVGLLYLAAAVGLGALFVGYAVQYVRDARRATARRIYLYSLVYLAALFLAMIVDTSLRL